MCFLTLFDGHDINMGIIQDQIDGKQRFATGVDGQGAPCVQREANSNEQIFLSASVNP